MNKYALITGCAGFIGSHVVEHFLKAGWLVTGVDKLNYVSNVEWLANLRMAAEERFKFVEEDICNLKRIADYDVIVNLAAESHVGNSIDGAKDFIHSNVDGVRNILDLIRALPKHRRPLLAHYSCYDEKTRALTTEGFKAFEEIKEGDEVISINPNNGYIEKKKIKKVIVQDYSGKMIHFKKNNEDLMVTPNHRMYYTKGSIKGGDVTKNIHVERADNIADKTNLYYPRGLFKGKTTADENIPEWLSKYKIEDIFFFLGIFLGDGFTSYQEKIIENKSGFNREDFLKNCRDEAGRFSKLEKRGEQENSVCKSWRIYIDVPEKDKSRKELEEVLTRLDISWSAQKNKSGEHIYFTSKDWVGFLNSFGQGFDQKHIPEWMFEYDYTILKRLFDGLIGSDGHYNKSGMPTFSTSSDFLLKDISRLGIYLGYHVRYATRKDGAPFYEKEKRIIKQNKDAYMVYFKQKPIGVGNHKYTEVEYDGKIWCLTVEDNKNFVVERNGILNISGNTDEVYGDIVHGSYDESSPLRPSNPYSASKAAADLLIESYSRTYGINYVILRPSNNYGIRQYQEKFIPITIKSLLQKRKVALHDNGLPVRSWVSVLDVANITEKMCSYYTEELKTGHEVEIKNVFNIPGQEMTNIEVFDEIVMQINPDMCLCDDDINTLQEKLDNYVEWSYHRPGQDVRYSVSGERLKRFFHPGEYVFRNIIEDLPEVISWYSLYFRTSLA